MATIRTISAPTVNIKNYSKMRDLLTLREKEVLLLIAHEYNNQEIANRLFLSKGTIATYRNNLLSKLQAKNTAGMIRIAFEKNILTLEKNGKIIKCNINQESINKTHGHNENEFG